MTNVNPSPNLFLIVNLQCNLVVNAIENLNELLFPAPSFYTIMMITPNNEQENVSNMTKQHTVMLILELDFKASKNVATHTPEKRETKTASN